MKRALLWLSFALLSAAALGQNLISGQGVSGQTQTGATVNWSTAVPTTAQVKYGTTSTYGSSTAVNSTLSLSHSVVLSNLSSGTTYHYQVVSSDSAGNTVVSPDATFQTVVAISVTISPTTPTVSSGGTQPFTATVSNDPSNSGVTWSATAGMVSSTGLFTAPTVTVVTTVTVTATSVADTTKKASATVTVNPPAGTALYALAVSTVNTRAGGIFLNGATLSGSVYIYTSTASAATNYTPTGITKVCYWLDNTAMSGTATHCESAVPYDFVGSCGNTTTSCAYPWSTSSVANGTHTITQQVTKSAGGTEVDTATFTVSNVSVTITNGKYEYAIVDQNLYVYDLTTFQQVKHISLPQVQGGRGMGAVPGTNSLYISYGGDGGIMGNGSLLKYNLLTDTVVWTKAYNFGIDSFAITPDGTTIWMPDGENSGNGIWYQLDAVTGNVLGSIDTKLNGPHNTVVSLDGTQVYMGPRHSSYLAEGATATNTLTLDMGPLVLDCRPFTINGKHTLAFTTATGFLGFQVSDTTTGNVLYTVAVSGFPINTSESGISHGISMSPDESEIYLIDTLNNYVHAFNVTGLPNSAPTQVADIPLTTNFSSGQETPCLYDCNHEGWIRHTLDGQYVLVGDSGNVVSTSSRTVVATLPQLLNTRKYIEIDWQNGVPVATSTRAGLGYVTH